MVSDYNQALQSFIEVGFSCVLMKGYEGFDSLNPVEKIEFTSQTLQFLRVLEQMYYASPDGSIVAEVFDGFTEQLRETLKAQGLRECLDQRNKWFGSRFRSYMEQLTNESDAIIGYYDFSGCDPCRRERGWIYLNSHPRKLFRARLLADRIGSEAAMIAESVWAAARGRFC